MALSTEIVADTPGTAGAGMEGRMGVGVGVIVAVLVGKVVTVGVEVRVAVKVGVWVNEGLKGLPGAHEVNMIVTRTKMIAAVNCFMLPPVFG